MSRHFAIICGITAVCLLSACGKKNEEKAASQVLARVDGEEITVSQLNHLLSKQPANAASTPEQKKQLLNALIEQQLLLKKATELKLDRDPTVLQALEQAKRDILVQEAGNRVIGKPAEPDAKDISAFFTAHPALFSGRKVYDFAAFSAKSDAITDAIKKQLDAVKTPEETKALLESAKVEFQMNNVRQTAEQLPLDQLAGISAMNPGDVALLNENGKTLILQLVHAEPAPVDETRAQPVIKTFLLNQRGQENARAKIDALKKEAKIEYLNALDAPAAANTPAATADKPAPSQDDHMKEGLKGLR